MKPRKPLIRKANLLAEDVAISTRPEITASRAFLLKQQLLRPTAISPSSACAHPCVRGKPSSIRTVDLHQLSAAATCTPLALTFMRPYTAQHSPSLNKHNGLNMMDSRRGKFNFGHIVGDPFALASVSISLLAWIITFVASIIANVQNPYPKYAWWTIAYMLCCIIGIFFVFATDSASHYSLAIVGYLAAGLVMTTSAVNSLVYQSESTDEAAAAGFILLSMINVSKETASSITVVPGSPPWQIIWIFYFGSAPGASSRDYVDQFALHKDRTSYRTPNTNINQPETSISQPQMYTSAQLNGFETSSPVAGYPGGPIGSQPRASTLPDTTTSGPGAASSALDQAAQPTEYPYKAKAIYSYEANPDDANEISFSKHEILEVSDVSGRWWQAKKENGETGIAPSNYLILL
ncbi:hypothetical protein DV737_g3615, partial [Chaetothyriales sp. CBS 132003]